MLRQPGEWQLAKGRSKPDKSRIRAERGTGEPMTLRGVKPERSVALYVKNIQVEEGESDSVIKVCTKQFCLENY